MKQPTRLLLYPFLLIALTLALIGCGPRDAGATVPALQSVDAAGSEQVQPDPNLTGDGAATDAETEIVLPEEIVEEAPAEQPAEVTDPAPAEEEVQPAEEQPAVETPAEGEGQTTTEQPPAEQPVEETVTQPAIGTETRHIVLAGQTVGTIAQTYNVSIADIVAANDLPNENWIYAGQELIIRAGAAPAIDPSTGETTTQPATGFDPNNYFVHYVASGETLFRIGQTYGFTVQELATYNGIANIDRIDLGQEIRIPNR